MKTSLRLALVLSLAVLVPTAGVVGDSNWPEWRGPARTGVSTETGLPSSWSPAGQNLAWKVPYGGRSAPVVFGDHLYLQNTVGTGATEQERLMCFHADTGKLLWEQRYNIFTSDVPAHRLAWASPAVDPASGNVIAISANGLLMALSPDGKLLWERSLAEEVGMWTTHGGRMSSPIIDGNQVIVSGLTFSWGQYAGGAHRFMSFDKTNGQMLWISAPEGRPTDTIYANPFIATVNGTRMFFSGGSDGAMHALKVATGEPVWNWLVSKRGLNTAALVVGEDVIVSHSEENIISNEMGMLAAVPAASTGMLSDKGARWLVRGVQAGYASPVTDGERIYVLDNGGVLFAFDLKSGKELWKESIGTIAKASPVLADGKLYLGTENTGDAGGKFYIIRPHADKAEILDQDWLGTPQKSEQIIASPIVARGRVYVASMDALYAIGPKTAPAAGKAGAARERCRGRGGGRRRGAARRADRADREARASRCADRARVRRERQRRRESRRRDLDAREPEGHRSRRQVHRRQRRRRHRPASSRRRSVRSSGTARIRVVPDLPWTFDFEDGKETPPPQWVNAAGKFAVRDVDGSKVLVKLAENPFAFAKRCRPFMGPTDLSDYTIQADVRGLDRRRQMGDIGIVAQRYELVLFGNHQRLELQPWQPEVERTVKVDYKWNPNAWYTMKLEVQSMGSGRVRARGKVWPKGETEPAAWTIERIDPIGSLKGAPGLYADAPSQAGGGSELYYDNIKVFKNAGK